MLKICYKTKKYNENELPKICRTSTPISTFTSREQPSKVHVAASQLLTRKCSFEGKMDRNELFVMLKRFFRRLKANYWRPALDFSIRICIWHFLQLQPGQHCIFTTDYRAFQFRHSCADPDGLSSGWSVRCALFVYTTQHCPCRNWASVSLL